MKHLFRTGIFIQLLFTATFAIGLQHGLFRSQSTQGAPWQGTATIKSEKYQITVYPDYLDVELDWTFTASGTEPDSFSNALEIVGNLNLEDNSTVVSMLVWYNGQILKGKLKCNEMARNQYEQVVERNADAPPPPRDPVLLEMIRDDNYDISIFPVTFGGERRVRIRYLIPGATLNGEVKMGYPHAFTSNAIVEIRTGAGVSGYRIETSSNVKPVYTNSDFLQLSKNDYSFQAYGSAVGALSINRIVPVVERPGTGSSLYISSFSTDNFSGSMVHASIPEVRNLLLSSKIKEDFVVIWRWNSTDILHAYTRQIVAQADALIGFFSALGKTSKRGALIISILDGETVTFSLDAPGGDTYKKMLSYLETLAALSVPVVTSGQGTTTKLSSAEIDALAKEAVDEFKSALESAIAMLSASGDTKRRILLLTAGAQGSTPFDTYTSTPGTVADVALFSTVYTGTASDFQTSVAQQRWPGVAMPPTVNSADTSLKVYGYISNGTETDSFLAVSSSSYSRISDRHLYSATPITEKIIWKIFSGGAVIEQIEETPHRIDITEGMQHARCFGALKSMMPLSSTMPSSLASTLGFIDMKYTLLALEEDVLPPADAQQYANEGVPLLTRSDIYPSSSEKSAIPVAEWLVANPREFQENGPIGWRNIVLDFAVAGGAKNLEVAVPSAGQQVWANTQAQVIISTTDNVVTSDYLVAPVIVQHKKATANAPLLHQRNSYLDITLPELATADLSRMEVVLYDMSGRVVARWKAGSLLRNSAASFSVKLPHALTGVYCVRIEGTSLQWSQSMLIR